MYRHANHKLGLAGRLALVRAIEDGLSPATAHRWWHRWLEASEARRTLSCLLDHSSRPHHPPPLLEAELQERI